MMLDRYAKILLTIIAVALVVIAIRPWLPDSGLSPWRPEAAYAQAPAPKYEVSIPKSWGKFVAFSNNNLLLEGSDHVMRIIDVEGRAPEYPRVKVQINWQ